MSETPAFEARATRAAAHAAAPAILRAAQRWQSGVTDEAVTRVMFYLESGVRPYRNAAGIWRAPTGSPLSSRGGATGPNLSTVVNEMIRTGLLRHLRYTAGTVTTDHLIPALVHARNLDNAALSACLFTGEDLGPMRSRIVDRLDLVDCLNCLHAIAHGQPDQSWSA